MRYSLTSVIRRTNVRFWWASRDSFRIPADASREDREPPQHQPTGVPNGLRGWE